MVMPKLFVAHYIATLQNLIYLKHVIKKTDTIQMRVHKLSPRRSIIDEEN